MIAEWFYPKELKEIIADLRAKGDLNEAAVYLVNKYIIRQVVFFISASILFFLYMEDRVITILPALCFLLIPSIHREIYKYKMRPYLEGEHFKFIITRRWHYMHGYVLVSNDEYGIKIKTPRLAELNHYKNLQKGVEVHGFMLDKPLRIWMPDIPELKKKYCLSKSMLEYAPKNSGNQS